MSVALMTQLIASIRKQSYWSDFNPRITMSLLADWIEFNAVICTSPGSEKEKKRKEKKMSKCELL